MAHDQQRPLPAAAFQTREQIRSIRIRADDRRRNAVALEGLLDVLSGLRFVARRVLRIDVEKGLKMAHRLLFDRLPIRLCTRLAMQDEGGGNGADQNCDENSLRHGRLLSARLEPPAPPIQPTPGLRTVASSRGCGHLAANLLDQTVRHVAGVIDREVFRQIDHGTRR